MDPWGRNLAYWQQCELAAALDRAIRLGIFDLDAALKDRSLSGLCWPRWIFWGVIFRRRDTPGRVPQCPGSTDG